MKKSVWLSFDLGLQGDYESLYAWLDKYDARECVDNLAFLKYEVNSKNTLIDALKRELKEAVKIDKRTRMYVVWLQSGTMKGSFIFGHRKNAPWIGYGPEKESEGEDVG